MLKNYLEDILIYNKILIIFRGFSHHSLIFTKLLNIHKTSDKEHLFLNKINILIS